MRSESLLACMAMVDSENALQTVKFSRRCYFEHIKNFGWK